MRRPARVLVTGGAGFIGSHVVEALVARGDEVLNVDRLSFPGARATVAALPAARHTFLALDLCERPAIREAVLDFAPEAVVHLAAESHVDRSIDDPLRFVRANVEGTASLLEACRALQATRTAEAREGFRFLHVSTDEVHGSLGAAEPPWTEDAPLAPNSPYAASKAASDHLVRAWGHTYGLPVLVTHCSNNYGPRQFPDKLIPVMIAKARAGEPLPVYGDGGNRRDWLWVGDHVRALLAVLDRARPGTTWNVGGGAERDNLSVVQAICARLDALLPEAAQVPHASLIRFVTDRPGHDRRYALDAGRIGAELGWRPEMDFDAGLDATVAWYLANADWQAAVTAGSYAGERLGRLPGQAVEP